VELEAMKKTKNGKPILVNARKKRKDAELTELDDLENRIRELVG
jgi:hypothetical protein